MPKEKIILGNLLHLSYNMWGDWKNPKMGPHWCYQPQLRFDEKLWNDLLAEMVRIGMNQLVIDLGDAIQYESHPEIAVQNAWIPKRLRSELKKLREMGLEPIPKLNFSACHDQWLGEYSRMVSSKIYYQVCKDLIAETIDLFDRPRFFHLGMDEEEIQHQRAFEYIVLRNHDLWWRDLKFLIDQVEAKGVRPWIWSDYIWNHTEEFLQKMPKSVIQSNWYRHPATGDAKSVYGADMNKDYQCVRSYLDLDQHGYDQIPTISNWETPDNIYNTVKFCEENLSPDRLKGYLLSPWRPTLEVARDRHMDALAHFDKATRHLR